MRRVHLQAVHPSQPSQRAIHALIEPDAGIVTLWEHRLHTKYTGSLYGMLQSYFIRLVAAEVAERKRERRAVRRRRR